MRHATVILAGLLAAGAALAQDPAPSLQDLVGVKGASGESALEQRGYTWIRTEKEGNDAYSYYRENENGQCVSVRTADGRYQSIVFAPSSDCEPKAAEAPAGRPGHGFETVCGVIVSGETYSYKCKVEDHYDGDRKVRTALYFPDQKLKMVWQPQNVVELHFEGMAPKTTTYATAEGETNFVFEDKTYFYISDPGMAAMEVEHFQP
jgi:hypothetical protein